MKENFHHCMEMLLHHEGGYVWHPDDPGGETNHGVTRSVYEEYIGRPVEDGEMKRLTQEDVYPIYQKNYWNRIKGDELPSGVDWAVFDWCVNSGVGRSAKALQKIIGATQDGGIGPKTLATLAQHDPKEIIEKMHDERQNFYEGLSTFKTFGKGWTRRNQETKEASLQILQNA